MSLVQLKTATIHEPSAGSKERRPGQCWTYAARLCALPGLREARVDLLLHHYRHSL